MAGKWHLMSDQEVLEVFRSDPGRGLEEREAVERLARFGTNELVREAPVSAGSVLIGQFRDFKLLVLLIAATAIGFLGDSGGAGAIIIIALINALVGFIQEYRTERAIERSKGMITPEAIAIRGGQKKRIPAKNLVPGDLVVLERGGPVPADIRLIWTSSLLVEESALNGRPAVVEKSTVVSADDPAGNTGRENMVLLGSTVIGGSGRGIVVATGMLTEAGLVAGVGGEAGGNGAGLQDSLAVAGSRLFNAGLFICLLVVILGVYQGEPLNQMLLAGISLAVVAVPGGLPAIASFSLALGMQRINRRHAVIRDPSVVEKLACVTLVCPNKTGILTENRMSVVRALVGGKEVEIKGDGYDPKGSFDYQGDKNDPGLSLFLKTAALCNNALLTRGDITVGGFFRDIGKVKTLRQWGIQGDPTEGALLVMAARGGVWRERLEKKESRLREIPFDSCRKRMTIIYQASRGGMVAYTKGAPEELVELCTHLYKEGSPAFMTTDDKEELLDQIAGLAARPFRVMALAYRKLSPEVNDYTAENVEKHMIFLGLAAISDNLEPAAVDIMHGLRRAGIKVIMITGEHQLTARSLAMEAGLLGPQDRIINGNQLAGMTDDELAREIESIRIFARIEPQQKQRLIRILKQSGHVVAVTGKGIGDITALKEADVSVAMENNGAAALKNVSAILFTGNNFSGFIDALREARGICDNIRTILRYLLSFCVSLLLLMSAALAAGFTLPLSPLQVLWAGLLAGGLPVLALGMEPPDRNVMFRAPGHFQEKIFSAGMLRSVMAGGVVAATASLATFLLLLRGGQDLAGTTALNTIIFLQMFYAFSFRYEYYNKREFLPANNPALAASLIAVIILQLSVTYLPFLQDIFHTVPLGPAHWGTILAVCVLPIISGPILRWLRSRVGQRIMYIKI